MKDFFIKGLKVPEKYATFFIIFFLFSYVAYLHTNKIFVIVDAYTALDDMRIITILPERGKEGYKLINFE